MVDRLSVERRSWLMSRVRSRDTSPELRVRRIAHGMGLRFRLHRRDLPGRPDLVFPKYKTVVFVHGCFWHRHPLCPKASTPKTKIEFWEEKFRRNQQRDRDNITRLVSGGWSVGIIWECETNNIDGIVVRLRDTLPISAPHIDLVAPNIGSKRLRHERS